MSVELRSISKSYGELPVVAGLSLEIVAGELFVLLGPSGPAAPEDRARLLGSCHLLTDPGAGYRLDAKT